MGIEFLVRLVVLDLGGSDRLLTLVLITFGGVSCVGVPCVRHIDGASVIKVEVFRPLFNIRSQPLSPADQISHQRKVAYKVR